MKLTHSVAERRLDDFSFFLLVKMLKLDLQPQLSMPDKMFTRIISIRSLMEGGILSKTFRFTFNPPNLILIIP